ncbi:aldo/keto reductase [Onishia niordana]|uniref:aldo/keto reductase n=1 Tax=Onishia niordana TaxID=2508711 RepID=UPI0010A0B124|nr:aldo/keto reductase [Halomonas niordiana]
MSQLPLDRFLPGVSALAYGCMALGGDWDASPVEARHVKQAHRAIDAALEAGINFFDHADIYALGKAESAFGRALKERPSLRDAIFLQSKCGIRFAEAKAPKRFDFSAEWVRASVEGSLGRLGVETLDVLQLHRPDPLMEPEEIAEVFTALKAEGKVRHFGVSNMQRHQLEFLQASLEAPLVANQLELGLHRLEFLEEGVLANQPEGAASNFTPGTLEYCRRQGMQLQAWGCLSQGRFTGRSLDDQPASVRATAALVSELAELYRVSREAIVLAWLRRHPANIQPVIGSSDPARIAASGEAMTIRLSREDWYRLYVSARGGELP